MNETVLITGASSGFGYEFAKLFAIKGYNLILVARNLKRLKEIESELRGTRITVIPKDLTEPNAVIDLYKEINDKDLHVDILINNAGFGLHGNFVELDINQQLNMIDLNVRALTELTYLALQEMKKKNHGKILNVASTAAFQPGPNMAVYFATKAYVLSLSEALVEELRDTEIIISTLCPGASETNFGKVAGAQETTMFKNAMKASQVVEQAYRGLMKGQRVVIPGKINKMGVFVSKILPRNLTTKIVKSYTNKKD